MNREKLFSVCESAEKMLSEKSINAVVFPYGHDLPVVVVEIGWGDWKHDHARAKWLMQEQGCVLLKSDVIEENGSDCYSAAHYFYVEGMHDEAV